MNGRYQGSVYEFFGLKGWWEASTWKLGTVELGVCNSKLVASWRRETALTRHLEQLVFVENFWLQSNLPTAELKSSKDMSIFFSVLEIWFSSLQFMARELFEIRFTFGSITSNQVKSIQMSVRIGSQLAKRETFTSLSGFVRQCSCKLWSVAETFEDDVGWEAMPEAVLGEAKNDKIIWVINRMQLVLLESVLAVVLSLVCTSESRRKTVTLMLSFTKNIRNPVRVINEVGLHIRRCSFQPYLRIVVNRWDQSRAMDMIFWVDNHGKNYVTAWQSTHI